VNQPLLAQPAMIPDSTGIEKIQIPQKAIDTYKKQQAFDYVVKPSQENIIIKALNWIKRQIKRLLIRFFTWLVGPKNAAQWVKIFVRSLPYIAIAVFTYLIFRFLIGANLIMLNKNMSYKTGQVINLNDEQIIKESNLDALIEAAIHKNDYRLAVRYYYLKLLKKLIDNQLIDWHPDKTNHDYINELQNTEIQATFKKLTYIYDYVWYGKYYPEKSDFSNIKEQFQNFNLK